MTPGLDMSRKLLELAYALTCTELTVWRQILLYTGVAWLSI